MKKIKPCPFCGSTASPKLIRGYYKVVCDNEECPSHYAGFLTKERAVEEWNKRLKPVKNKDDSSNYNVELVLEEKI
jgi:hypothetical protein